MSEFYREIDVITKIVNSVSSCPAIKISEESMRRIMPAGMRIENMSQLLEKLSLRRICLSYDFFSECYVAVNTKSLPLIDCPQGWIDDLADVAQRESEEISQFKAAGVQMFNWADDE